MEEGWSNTEIEETAHRFKAVAHPLRLAIVCLLADGERSVGDICTAVGTSQPNITHHLIVLHNLKLLKSRKENNRVYYALCDPRLSGIITMLQRIYCP